MNDYVILVDEQDRPIGSAEKMRAHAEGLLHRAFSVFLFNEKGRMLLQRRHPKKYHSGGLWSNACCSHPRPGEGTDAAAVRRVHEELGIRCSVHPIFTFTYRVQLGDLVEHEYDHVFLAFYSGPVKPNRNEVTDVQWAGIKQLEMELDLAPERYTYWFRRAYRRVWREARPAQWR